MISDLELDVLIFAGHTLRDLAEQPVGAEEQVVLGGAGDLARPALRLAPPRQIEGESGNAFAATLGDHLQRVGAGPEIGHRLLPSGARKPQRREVLNGALAEDIEILEILAHNYEIDPLGRCERTPNTLGESRRAHVGERLAAPTQVEERARARAARRAEQRRVRLVDRRLCLCRKGLAVHLNRGRPDRWIRPVYVQRETLEKGHSC